MSRITSGTHPRIYRQWIEVKDNEQTKNLRI